MKREGGREANGDERFAKYVAAIGPSLLTLSKGISEPRRLALRHSPAISHTIQTRHPLHLSPLTHSLHENCHLVQSRHLCLFVSTKKATQYPHIGCSTTPRNSAISDLPLLLSLIKCMVYSLSDEPFIYSFLSGIPRWWSFVYEPV